MVKKSKGFSINGILVYSVLSVLFCWFFGILSFSFSLIAMVKAFKADKPKGKDAQKLIWAKVLSIGGLILSILFMTYYFMVLDKGVFIHF